MLEVDVRHECLNLAAQIITTRKKTSVLVCPTLNTYICGFFYFVILWKNLQKGLRNILRHYCGIPACQAGDHTKTSQLTLSEHDPWGIPHRDDISP